MFHTTIGYCCRQGIHCCVRPQPLMNKDIKVKDNKQKPKGACPARTVADSDLQPKFTTSCPICSNTFVMRSPFVRVCLPACCDLLLRVCPRSVGTRQALLQGLLLCVSFVCLANVPDLVQWQYESVKLIMQ